MHLVDSHPGCPTNSFGQPVIVDNGANVPWKQSVYMQLVGYRVYEEVQAIFRYEHLHTCVCLCVDVWGAG